MGSLSPLWLGSTLERALDAIINTRMITCLLGNPYKPSFVTVTWWGVDPRDDQFAQQKFKLKNLEKPQGSRTPRRHHLLQEKCNVSPVKLSTKYLTSSLLNLGVRFGHQMGGKTNQMFTTSSPCAKTKPLEVAKILKCFFVQVAMTNFFWGSTRCRCLWCPSYSKRTF